MLAKRTEVEIGRKRDGTLGATGEKREAERRSAGCLVASSLQMIESTSKTHPDLLLLLWLRKERTIGGLCSPKLRSRVQ